MAIFSSTKFQILLLLLFLWWGELFHFVAVAYLFVIPSDYEISGIAHCLKFCE